MPKPMTTHAPTSTLELAVELAELERPRWRAISARIVGPRMEEAGDPPANDPPAGDPPAGDPPGDDLGESVTLTKAEHDAIIAERDSARKAAATANRAQKERERQAAKDGGKFEELYKSSDEKATKLETRLVKAAIGDAVQSAASRLKFRNPALAAKLIDVSDITIELDLDSDDAVALDSAQAAVIERRLKAAAEADPYLVAEGGSRMLPNAGTVTGGEASGNAAMNQAIRRAAGRG